MQGLKTQESNNFIQFFERVQDAANKINRVFFLECEDGNDSQIDGLDVCDLQGWLIPEDRVDEFEAVWKKDEVDDEWTDFFVFMNCEKGRNGLEIKFE